MTARPPDKHRRRNDGSGHGKIRDSFRRSPGRRRDYLAEPPRCTQRGDAGDDRRTHGIFFRASSTLDDASRHTQGHWTGVLRGSRTRIGGVFLPRRRTSTTSIPDAAALFGRDPADAKLPAADYRAGSGRRMRRRLFAGAGLGCALRRTRSPDECSLYSCRRRRLLHGIRIFIAAAHRTFGGVRIVAHWTLSWRRPRKGRRAGQ